MKWLLLAGGLLVAFWITAMALRPPEAGPGVIKLRVWGMSLGEEDKGFAAQIREFERRNPGIEVSVLSMGAGAMNPQKLLTAIVGKSPPDLVFQDRFTIGDWASRGAFEPLDDLLERDRDDPMCPRQEDYYPATWSEAVYRGKVYAIPAGTDDRALYWNREVFRQAAPRLRKAGLDPTRPPRTWSELKAYALALTERRPDGTFKRIGFIPNFGNSWLYLYSWQMNGEFMSPDGKTCTLDNPRTRKALEFMVEMYDMLGGIERIEGFVSGFQGNELDPFLTGKLAMKIDGSWSLGHIARYRPTLDFGVAPAPVPDDRYYRRGEFRDEKDTFITWGGGFSYAIPTGSKNVEAAWKFIKWMTSPESAVLDVRVQGEYYASLGRINVMTFRANRIATERLYREFRPESENLAAGLRQFIDLLPTARFRPVTFVGQKLWDEHVRAFDQAVRHVQTPEDALRNGRLAVQRELDRVSEIERYPEVPAAAIDLVAGLVIGGVLGGIVFALLRVRRMSRLARGEALAGYAFITPWVLGFVCFTAGPILVSILLSFCHYDAMHPARWVGTANYSELFTSDWAKFGKAAYNVFYLAVIGVPLNLVTGLAIAMLLNTGVRGMTVYRTGFYIPAVAPIVAAGVLWAWVLSGDPEKGLLNAALRVVWSGELPGWLSSATWSKPALIVMGLWGAGGGMVLWLAGLQGVPKQLYEAARIDGANSWQCFRKITLPQISPYLFFNVIMGSIGALQEFDRIYIMRPPGSEGVGPVDSLLVPVFYLFDNGFKYFRMGYASSIAWVLFVVVLALTVIQLKLAPRWVYYEGARAKE
ncbi:MAG: extracellular solute-binding protein [Fimbriimonadia bacterium]|jgi:multiple sugar transport system permease protein